MYSFVVTCYLGCETLSLLGMGMSSRLIHSMVYPIQWSQVSLGHQRHTQIDVGTTAIRYVEAVNYFDTKITRIYKFQQKKEQMEKTPG